jgi:hypothetical protein
MVHGVLALDMAEDSVDVVGPIEGKNVPNKL